METNQFPRPLFKYRNDNNKKSKKSKKFKRVKSKY